ncbi:MAG: FAD-dependent thymidylate synthase [Synergistales bacterium]|nr:FAD-dependent thymidylate synthase [Synergistales bacterium]
MSVRLLAHTPDAARVVAAAARLCYSDATALSLMEGLDETKASAFLAHLNRSGHFSPFEHASFTFAVDGISRVCSHQLVRHRLASYSQQSQRYVEMGSVRVVLPPSVAGDAEASRVFLEAAAAAHEAYAKLVALGFPKEDARYLLPHGWETRLVVTMNARELHHFFSLRLCRRAQWEIRDLAREMLRLVLAVAPSLFSLSGPSCVVRGVCGEERPCGRPYASVEELLA